MPVTRDESGRRSVQAEVEVPGRPEEIWQAIATGPGISAWFVPTQVDGRAGGHVTANFGPGMDSVATITAWEPPRRFMAESQDLGPTAPTVATEWRVETGAGDVCVVRVIHSWFTNSDEWDGQFEGHTHGWQSFFRLLRLYLAHFSGQTSAARQLMGVAPEPTAAAWATLMGALGVGDVAVGERIVATAPAPELAGIVERVGPPDYPELLVRLDRPTTGLAHLLAVPMNGQVYLSIRFFLYGAMSARVAADVEPVWRRWLDGHLPAAG